MTKYGYYPEIDGCKTDKKQEMVFLKIDNSENYKKRVQKEENKNIKGRGEDKPSSMCLFVKENG